MKVQSIAKGGLRRCAAAVALLAGLTVAGAVVAEAPAALVVDGASSLTDSLQRVGDEFTAATRIPVKFSFAASSALARQIEAGAPADVFFSADPDWMDYLEQRHLIRTESRRNLLGNRLALVAPAQSKLVLHIEPHFALRAALGQERLATGDPDVVPVGRYARAALTSLGVWDGVADRLVRAENVRSALIFVARGEVPLGIVYETDARVDPKVRIVDLFPADTHPPIIYPAALTSTSSPNAIRFMEFLRAPAARATFEKFGFTVLP
jgi:molybdate transport system substrate-binding protein